MTDKSENVLTTDEIIEIIRIFGKFGHYYVGKNIRIWANNVWNFQVMIMADKDSARTVDVTSSGGPWFHYIREHLSEEKVKIEDRLIMKNWKFKPRGDLDE